MILAAITVLFLCSSCQNGLFRKKEKLGCKTNGRNIGAEQLASGDKKIMKAASKSKYKGGKKF